MKYNMKLASADNGDGKSLSRPSSPGHGTYLSYVANIIAMKTKSDATTTVNMIGSGPVYCSLKIVDGYRSKNI
jgi:hypothetical protein